MVWNKKLVLLMICLIGKYATKQPPHIVLIVADDLGWTDVGFHGSDQIPTPNIDKLAKEGVILNNYYVQPRCSPTRSALMTGRYPIHNGMFHDVIRPDEPFGVPLDEKILPQYMQEIGYATHIIGKWHIGFFEKEYTPTYRGFDSFYGIYNGQAGHFYHNKSGFHFRHFRGLDLHYDRKGNLTPISTEGGHYSSDLYTKKAIKRIQNHPDGKPLFLYLPYQNVHGPLQAPDEWINKFNYIKDKKRRIFAAMVGCLDDSVGKVHAALDDKGMLDNTVIVFTSDNGAIASLGFSSNYPFRGEKRLVFEGGVRVPAFINSRLLNRTQHTSMQLMHVTDWLPTFVNLAGGNVTTKLDGYDQWNTFEGKPTPRKEILLNIDHENGNSQEALIMGKWKIIKDHIMLRGKTVKSDSWLQAPGYNASGKSYSVVDCGGKPVNVELCIERHCLFDIEKDPCEYNDLSDSYVDKYELLKSRLNSYKTGMVPSRNQPGDKMADPKLHGGVWMPWRNSKSNSTSKFVPFSLHCLLFILFFSLEFFI